MLTLLLRNYGYCYILYISIWSMGKHEGLVKTGHRKVERNN